LVPFLGCFVFCYPYYFSSARFFNPPPNPPSPFSPSSLVPLFCWLNTVGGVFTRVDPFSFPPPLLGPWAVFENRYSHLFSWPFTLFQHAAATPRPPFDACFFPSAPPSLSRYPDYHLFLVITQGSLPLLLRRFFFLSRFRLFVLTPLHADTPPRLPLLRVLFSLPVQPFVR